MSHKNRHFLKRRRRGAIAVLAALMIAAFVGMVAFAVDYGYLLKVRTDLQRAADAAALAAVRDLMPAVNQTLDLDQVRATARVYAQDNLEDASFQIADADIEIGRFDPDTIYTSVTLLNDGIFDAVRVTLRRDGSVNPLVPLFFARALGRDSSAVTASATAVLQKAELMGPGADVLPFATEENFWNDMPDDDGDPLSEPLRTWNAYGDGRLEDGLGNPVPGNWGTLDIGQTDNSTSDLVDQILSGLRQKDLDALRADGRITDNEVLNSADTTWMNGDTGLSVGIKSGVIPIHNERRLIPIYRGLLPSKIDGSMTGSNLEYGIVKWGVVIVKDSKWQGEKNTNVTLIKSRDYQGELRAKPNLDGTTAYIEGAYTSPVLVE